MAEPEGQKIMGQILMVKRRCVCGELENVELLSGYIPVGKMFGKKFYYVSCSGCGRKTAKHTGPEEAIREWNHMEDGNNGESD